MAEGFDIHLNDDQARRLKAAAEAAGRDPTALALELLEAGLAPSPATMVREEAAPWVDEDEARWAEYQRTGETVPLEDALNTFDKALDEKLRAKTR